MLNHIGNNAYVNPDQVSFVVAVKKGSRSVRQIQNDAIASKKFYRLNGQDAAKSVIVLTNGAVLTSCVSAKTLARHIGEEQSLVDAKRYVNREGVDTIGQAEDADEAYMDDSYGEINDGGSDP